MNGNRAIIGQLGKAEQKPVSMVPWVPTPLETAKQMLELAQVGSKDIVYDLGCGDARMLIMAIKEFGARKAVGYEIRQDLLENSKQEIQRQNVQSRITLVKGDMLEADLSEASVIVLYLTSRANEHLRPKLEKELKPGTRIVSYYFKIDPWKPASTEMSSTGTLYLYLTPQAFQSSTANSTDE